MVRCKVFLTPPVPFDLSLQAAGCYCEYEDKILILKRHPSKREGGTWCMPGGTLEQAESPMQAVIREVYEEVGVRIAEESLKPLGSFYIRSDLEYVFHVFRYQLVTKPTIILALDEHTEAKWVTLEEALHLPLITGGKDVLMYYANMVRDQN